MDDEVASATHGLMRQQSASDTHGSALGGYSAHTPDDDDYSDESASERSSPVDI